MNYLENNLSYQDIIQGQSANRENIVRNAHGHGGHGGHGGRGRTPGPGHGPRRHTPPPPPPRRPHGVGSPLARVILPLIIPPLGGGRPGPGRGPGHRGPRF